MMRIVTMKKIMRKRKKKKKDIKELMKCKITTIPKVI